VQGKAQAPNNQQERVPMSISFVRLISRLLIVCLMGLPFQVQAGMIGTDDVVTAAQAAAARTTVASVMSRSDVASQLQSYGLSAGDAKARVAALTDAEVVRLAGQIDTAPAGASTLAWVIVIGLLIWWLVK
jgi:hypothetical protein